VTAQSVTVWHIVALVAPIVILGVVALAALYAYGRGRRWRRARLGVYLEREPLEEPDERETGRGA
jgi:hypothetical protein